MAEHLTRRGPDDVAARMLAFSAARNRDPRALSSEEKREILHRLAAEDELDRRGVPEKIATLFGISRSNVYYYLKTKADKKPNGRVAKKPRRFQRRR